jgi:mandelate racemase
MISKLQANALLVPMAEPHRTASGIVAASPLVAVQITVQDAASGREIVGQALVFTYTPAALEPTAQLIRNFAPLVEGQANAPATLWQALHARFRLLGTQGLVGMALAGIDMALWDAHARSQALPLHQLLGAAPKPLRPYGPIGFDGELGSAQAAEAWAKSGLQGVKAKIGYPTLAQDIAVIRAVRSAVGESVAIMVDYNQSLDATEAALRLSALDAEGLAWIEEPCASHDFATHARLSAATQTPLQSGENWWGPADFAQALDAGIGDLAMPDVMKVGGVTGWLRAAHLCAAKGISISNHLWPELSAHLLAASPTAGAPHGWLEWANWWDPINETPFEHQNGQAHWQAPWASQPGSGLNLKPSALAKYRV